MTQKAVYYLDFVGCEYRIPFRPKSDSKLDVYRAALKTYSTEKAAGIREEEEYEASFHEERLDDDDDDEEYNGADHFQTSEVQILRVENNLIEDFGEIIDETDKGFVRFFEAAIAKELKKLEEKKEEEHEEKASE
jgi:hypothetical protein